MGRLEELVRIFSPFFECLRKLETTLKCPVCNNLLDEPKLLRCNHIICQNCLPPEDEILSRSRCPKCMKFRPKDARGSLYVEEMIKMFNDIDGEIPDLINKSISHNASFAEDPETEAIQHDFEEKNHASAASRSYIKDEAIVSISVTDNLCNEEQNDATSAKHSKSCALNMSHTNSTCEIIETNSISSATNDSFKKKEIEIRRGTSESKNPSADQTESAKRRREDKSTTGSGSGSKRCDLESTIGSGSGSKICNLGKSNEQEKKPRTTPINLFDDECAFCHSFRITELYGPIVCYLNGILVESKEVDQKNVIYVHEKCLKWAPKIHYSGDNVMNLEEEIERGEQLICSRCGIKGAVLGCFYGPCRKSYHATCALEIDCSWDSTNFKMLCPDHAFVKLKPGEFIFDVL
ncbi:BRCA1-associated RING domain protein 1-like [Carex rostrata]